MHETRTPSAAAFDANGELLPPEENFDRPDAEPDPRREVENELAVDASAGGAVESPAVAEDDGEGDGNAESRANVDRAAAAAARQGDDSEEIEPRPDPAEALGPITELADAARLLNRLRDRLRAQVLGRDEVIDLILIALLADGHVLLEDFPGSGKTTLAKTLGGSIEDDLGGSLEGEPEDGAIVAFRRIQFTPDLLPSDVTGVTIFDAASGRFPFRHGPIFAHVVLADEINRTSPKVQAAMLEAMAEKQVTVDNQTYPLDDLFFVIATQNPLDLAGTYPLPVAQLDRFLFKIRMEHIDRESELSVLRTWQKRRDTQREDLPRVTRSQVLDARRVIDRDVAIDPRIQECLVDVVRAIRDDDRVIQGPSTRSLVLILPALQARAALLGRDYVSADDLEALIPRVFDHRIELAPGFTDLELVLRENLAAAVEGLSRSTLRRA